MKLFLCFACFSLLFQADSARITPREAFASKHGARIREAQHAPGSQSMKMQQVFAATLAMVQQDIHKTHGAMGQLFAQMKVNFEAAAVGMQTDLLRAQEAMSAVHLSLFGDDPNVTVDGVSKDLIRATQALTSVELTIFNGFGAIIDDFSDSALALQRDMDRATEEMEILLDQQKQLLLQQAKEYEEAGAPRVQPVDPEDLEPQSGRQGRKGRQRRTSEARHQGAKTPSDAEPPATGRPVEGREPVSIAMADAIGGHVARGGSAVAGGGGGDDGGGGGWWEAPDPLSLEEERYMMSRATHDSHFAGEGRFLTDIGQWKTKRSGVGISTSIVGGDVYVNGQLTIQLPPERLVSVCTMKDTVYVNSQKVWPLSRRHADD